VINRYATIKLTKRDKAAARAAYLDSSQGVVRKNGTL